MDNLRSVVAWSSAGADGGEALIRIVCALAFFYWRIRGDPHEGLRWSELALATAAAEPPSADRMRLLWAAGAVAAFMERHTAARAWLEETVRMARASGDDLLLGCALVFLGWSESHVGDRSAPSHIEDALSVLRAVGDLDDLVLALNVAAVPYVILGDLAAARAALTDGVTTAREFGDGWATAVALSSAGYLDIRERNWSSARVHLEQALAIHRRLGDEGSVGMIYNNLAVVARHTGRCRGCRGLARAEPSDAAPSGARGHRHVLQPGRLGSTPG
jgi:tetratricopeptide (TPR) repeat protein